MYVYILLAPLSSVALMACFVSFENVVLCALLQAKTTFHGHELVDYQGRSWTAPPSGIRAEHGTARATAVAAAAAVAAAVPAAAPPSYLLPPAEV